MSKLLAHRGYCEIAPENTKLAFDAAKLFGFHGIEIDVHMTKDKELVLIHDERVDRTSDGKGAIQDLKLKELRKLNFAAKFGEEYPKQQILTYEEFLNLYGNEFRVINTEIKTGFTHYKDIEKIIWKVHQKVKPKSKIIYSSFNLNSLVIMKQVSDNKSTCGFLFVDEKDCIGHEETIKNNCEFIHPWFKSMLSEKSLDYYYEKLKLPINIWTFDRRTLGDKWSDGSGEVYEKISKMKDVKYLISNSIFKA